jgi:hypothetical protein
MWRKTQFPHETDKKKQRNTKKQPPPTAILWHPAKRHTHTKRKKLFYDKKDN